MPELHVVTSDPPNAGVDPATLHPDASQADVFERNNFPIPASPPTAFSIRVPGADDRVVTLDDLATHERVGARWMLECAGNARTGMDPRPAGTPWPLAAMTPVSAEGVRLTDVLGNLPEDVVDVVFTGADRGRVRDEGVIPYQFSLPRHEALETEALLVTKLNGEPLSTRHGGPIRLMVPGAYGMKSVKWLTSVEAITHPFDGHFVRKYRYRQDVRFDEEAPVDRMLVRSVIVSPSDGAVIGGQATVRGAAWSGTGAITEVAVRTEPDGAWVGATLRPDGDLTWFEAPIAVAPGTTAVVARATDESGAVQPFDAPWNFGGYGNNAVHRVGVTASP